MLDFLRGEADSKTTCNCFVGMDHIAYIDIWVVKRKDLNEIQNFVVICDIELELARGAYIAEVHIQSTEFTDILGIMEICIGVH